MRARTTGDNSSATRWQTPAVLGAVLVLGLGVARGGVQSVVQHATHPIPIIVALVAASLVWLPVPLAIDRVVRADVATVARWSLLLLCAAAIAVIEPLWFIGTLTRLSGWRPRGGFGLNAALRLDTNLLIVGAIVGWLWLREVQRRQSATEERAADLRTHAGNAELEVLTMQLQPHFLFNTLNLVSQLAYESTDRARGAVANLRRLLGESVAGRGSKITLAEELRLLGSYLDLQRDRFGSRLDARITVDDDVLAAQVPRMLLQPVVENAIRHGIAPRRIGGSVTVHAWLVAGARVAIDVTDDGVGLTPSRVTEGVGLANVRHRLEQLYPSDVRVDLVPGAIGGAVTRLEFPLDTTPPALEADEVSDAEVDALRINDDASIGVPDARLRALVVICAWAAIGAIWTELEAIVPQSTPWTGLFAKNMLNAGVWMALTPFALRFVDRLASRAAIVRVPAHVVGAAAFTATHLLVTGLLMRVVMHAHADDIWSMRVSWAVWDVTAYATLVAIGEMIAVRALLREQAVESARTRARLAVARVSLMRLHLQPGIFLSSLDAVDDALGDPERCETVLARLGDVLRLLLATAGCEETSIRDELALLDDYMAVIGREVSSMTIDARVLDAMVPTVLLCPLAASLSGAIRVAISRADEKIVIELGADDGSVDSDLLAGTERRLSLLFLGAHSMRVMRRGEGVVVVLQLPFHIGESTVSRRAFAEHAIA